MTIKTKNKYIGRALGWLFNIPRYSVRYEFSEEVYDKKLMESAFYRQTLMKFEDSSEQFKERLEQVIEDAIKKETD